MRNRRIVIRANSQAELQRKLDRAVKDAQRKAVDDIRREIRKAFRKH